MKKETYSINDENKEERLRLLQQFCKEHASQIKKWTREHPKDVKPPIFWDGYHKCYLWLTRPALRARQKIMKKLRDKNV